MTAKRATFEPMKAVILLLEKMNMKSRFASVSDKKWMMAISDLGCIVCKNLGYGFSPAAIHHIDGKTKKGAHKKTIPLCGAHHQTGGYGVALHAGRKHWEDQFGTQQKLLMQVQKLLANERI